MPEIKNVIETLKSKGLRDGLKLKELPLEAKSASHLKISDRFNSQKPLYRSALNS
jgi:hypothetical protein